MTQSQLKLVNNVPPEGDLLASTYSSHRNVHNTSLSAKSQGHGPLFLLPPELRNRIYELVFEFNNDTEELIELTGCITLAQTHRSDTPTPDVRFSLPPPTSALLCTCQQLYTESALFLKPAQHRYYSKNFFIDFEKISCRSDRSKRNYFAFAPVSGIPKYTVQIEEPEAPRDGFDVAIERWDEGWRVVCQASRSVTICDGMLGVSNALLRVNRCIPTGKTLSHGGHPYRTGGTTL